MNKFLHILLVFLFSLYLPACSNNGGGGGSSNSTDTTPPPTVSFTSPADNQSGVSISDSIAVTFSEGMDTTSITTNTSDTTCSGTIQVSSSNFQYCVKMSSSPSSSNSDKTYTVDPSDNLSYSTTYKIRVTTGVKDSSGDAMLSQYETSSGFIVAIALPAYITSMVEVEGGNNFSCSRRSDGTVWCWGSDASGQLGSGGFSSTSTVAREVNNLTNAADLCVGYEHACAVKTDGKMFCWGKGTDDRLGFGSSDDQKSPVEVKNISNAVSCSLGTNHSCVKLSDKTTRCWGNAGSGQLGNGQLSTDSMTIPVSVYGISNAAQISAGRSHACAVLDDGSIACWGSGLNGELGIGIVGTKSTPAIVPVSGTFTQVSAGYGHTCALKNDGTVWCFGDNDNGQLGDGSTTDSFTAVQVSSITNARHVTTGYDFSCALLTDNTTKCWGENYYGQLGDKSNTDRLTPVNVKLSDGNNLSNVRSISSNRYTSCAVLNSNNARCWGSGSSYQIGDNTNGNKNYARALSSSISFNLIANGPLFTCGILTGGSVSCWGYEQYGERGDSVSGGYRSTPDTTVQNISSVIDLDLGEKHACSIDNSQKISCWGRNNYGQIGFGSSTSEYSSPVEVIGITNAVEVDLGDDFSCARLSDKTVKCWGHLNNGRLGYGVGPVSAPVYNVSDAKEISMGTNHSCVLNDNGTVKCWGAGSDGRLGDGYTSNRTYPVDVYNLSNASQIVTGNDFTCALRSDSNIACWGNNTDGIAGTWGEVAYTPTNIPSISDVKSIDAGNSHVCGLLNSGTVKCWGKGTNGQLGNAIASTSETPQTVFFIDSATSIGLGENHSCAVLDNNYVVCWGLGSSGQLGTNDTYSSSVPVPVRYQ